MVITHVKPQQQCFLQSLNKTRAVKRFIASKIKVFVYIIYVNIYGFIYYV